MAALPLKSFGRAHASTPLRQGRAIRYNLPEKREDFHCYPSRKGNSTKNSIH
tara:strand:+ start:23087 stop:23242 length:156 start_codon:yes stop_codon:yes gene_type:complete